MLKIGEPILSLIIGRYVNFDNGEPTASLGHENLPETSTAVPGYGCSGERLTHPYAEIEFRQKYFSATARPLPEKYSRTIPSTWG